MNTIVEYAPLIALMSPVLVLAGLNAWLKVKGEEGTLLFPSRSPYPPVTLPHLSRPAAAEEAEIEDQVMEPEYREAA